MPSTVVRPTYNAEIREVISGDDLRAFVELGTDDLFKLVRLRLAGVDTPDAYRAGSDSEAGQVREFVRRMVFGKKCRIEVLTQSRSSGWKVELFIMGEDGAVSVNQRLINQGYVYAGRSKEQG